MMEWNGGMRSFFWPFVGVFAIISLAILAFDVWMLVDAIQRPAEQYSSRDARTWWIVGLIVGLVTGLPAIAVAIAYYIVVKRPAAERRTPGVASGTAPPASPPPMPPGQAPPVNCRNCGAKIVAGARFCHSCGASTI
jgi:zinc-ribbon domain